jgi:hypothetical protein
MRGTADQPEIAEHYGDAPDVAPRSIRYWCMDIRRHTQAKHVEHWIYVMALVNTVVVIALLYTVKAPINFVFW